MFHLLSTASLALSEQGSSGETYNVGELVPRLPEKKKNKLALKWEVTFTIDDILTRGAYCLRNASDNRLEPNPWKVACLRRFYT